MEIVFIRHGKTKGNLEGRYVGRTDEPLLIEEIQRLQKSPYRAFAPDVVYTSGMLRCRQTAEVLFGKCGEKNFPVFGESEVVSAAFEGLQTAGGKKICKALDRKKDSVFAYAEKPSDLSERGSVCDGIRMVVHVGLNETDFGAFEYKNYEELKGNSAYQAWLDSGGTLAFPDGESGADFRARCREAFLECIADAKKRNAGRVAFVVHGGTIMAIMEAFAVPKRGFYEWQVKNGEGFLVEMDTSLPDHFLLTEKAFVASGRVDLLSDDKKAGK